MHQILTYSTLLDFLCCDPENRENLDHYLNDYVHHFRGRLRFCVDLETSEKHLNPFKDVDKCVLARSNIFSCLGEECVTVARTKLQRIHTDKRTPTPVKITLAGEKSCHINMSERISDKGMS